MCEVGHAASKRDWSTCPRIRDRVTPSKFRSTGAMVPVVRASTAAVRLRHAGIVFVVAAAPSTAGGGGGATAAVGGSVTEFAFPS